MSILGILAPFATFRYEMAILIKEKSHPASSLLLLSITIIIVSSLLLYLLGPQLGSLLGIGLIGEITSVFVAMFFLSAAIETLAVWHIGKKRFVIVTVGKLIQAASTVLSQIIFSSKYEMLGLVYGFFIGLILGFIYYGWELFRKDAASLNYHDSISHIRLAAVIHRNFPLYSIWASVLNSVVNQLPVILFGKFFSVGVTGNYEMARRMTRAPLSLVGQSIFRVTSQHIGEMADDKKKSGEVLERLFSRMAGYAIIPFLIIVFFLDHVFSFVLGDQWATAGVYAQIISPWLFSLFLSWPLTSAYNTFNYQARLVVFNIVFILCFLVAFSAHLLFGLGDLQVLIIMSVLSSLARLWYCHWILSKCGSQRLYRRFSLVLFYLFLIGSISYLKIDGVFSHDYI